MARPLCNTGARPVSPTAAHLQTPLLPEPPPPHPSLPALALSVCRRGHPLPSRIGNDSLPHTLSTLGLFVTLAFIFPHPLPPPFPPSPARQAPLTMAMRRVRTTLVAGVAGAGAVVALGSAAPAAAQAGGGGGAPLVTDFAALIDQARCEALAPLRAGIVPTAGNSVTGYVLMAPVWRADTSTCATSVKASLTNMPTAGAAHGFHIHTFGDTTKDDGTSAGGHYNPEDVDHGLPTAEVRHVGDLGNIEVGDDQTAEYDQTSELISLPHVVGRSVVIHADPDDGGQPTGNAGKRLAQGVLGYMETEG